MQHAALNRAPVRMAETTGVSGRLTAEATIQAQGVSTQISDLQTQLAELQSQVQALQRQLAALQSNDVTQLNPYVSVDPNPINGLNGPNIIFTGANIHIRSGSGATDDNGNRSGLGNLIIGYDEELPPPSNPLKPGDRGGSNNLVIGRYHRFTSAAFGGLVAGEANMISAEGASVSGGFANGAIRAYASVSGGYGNTAKTRNEGWEEIMKKRLVVPLVGLAISFALPTYAQQKAMVPDQQVIEQLGVLGQKYQEAYAHNDAAALAACYTFDAILVTPQGPVYGRDAIENWYADQIEQWHPKSRIDKVDPDSLRLIGTAGDAVSANGDWKTTIQDPNGGLSETKGYWSSTYVREGDTWKIRLDTFNVTPVPAATPSQSE